MQKVKQTAIKARKRYCEPHFLFILIIVYVKAVLADDSGVLAVYGLGQNLDCRAAEGEPAILFDIEKE